MAKNCLILFNLSEGLLGTIKKRNQLNGNEMIVSGSDPAIFGPKRAFLDAPCTSLADVKGQNCFKPASYIYA